ncbi:HlyD family efflux transporter periplasmic adaptor subunit [Candidatus Roizmanbacteria bacterium]|nr:HlyD family efflux transporter periplasmic adaptor subunit [Candidatus Roizmanbacteria bacterium]
MNTFKSYSNQIISSLKRVINKKPLVSFFAVLALLFLLIAIGTLLRKPKVVPQNAAPQQKKVAVYQIGSAPRITVQAQVEKTNVVQISAQTGGVVSYLNVSEGMDVSVGTTLVSLASSYAGGNVLSLQRQLAQKQYQNVLDTYDTQKDLIQKNRDIANTSNTNTDSLRDISRKSLDDTKALLSLEQDILSPINQSLDAFVSTNSANQNSDAIYNLKKAKAQLQPAINQLQDTVRQSEYQVNTDNPPTQIVDLQRGITLKQIDIQEKSLDLEKEVTRLQLAVAQVNESTMYPAAPFAGRVERVHVRVGELVNPGQALVTFSGNAKNFVVVAQVPKDMAASVSRLEKSTIHLGSMTIEMYPTYVSREATDGQNYSVIYAFDPDPEYLVTDNSYVTVEIPIGYPDTGKTIPYVPLDAVHQTQEAAFVYIIEHGKAIAREVTLGTVVGQYVEIKNGLKDGDTIILDRNVVANEAVTR